MKILIINLGSQYTHLIWRTIRDIGVEAIIQQPNLFLSDALFFDSIILSGGPSSVNTMKKNTAIKILELEKDKKIDKPILGICLGHQLIAHVFGGQVEKGLRAEYGLTKISIIKEHKIFEGVPRQINAWSSHFDQVTKLPKEFETLARSENCQKEALAHLTRPIIGLQFHPEVLHTEYGEKILYNFVRLAKEHTKT